MLLAIAERMLNEQIRASTAARERLGDLDGKRFAVSVRGSDLRVVAESAGGRLCLSHATPAACDVELDGGVIDLMRLAHSASLSDLKGTSARLSGDLHVAEAFAALIRLAMPEPEAVLADYIGDVPAHALGEGARRLGGLTLRAGRAFERNLGEYLQEESPALVPPPLARHFIAAVDRLRDDVERAEKRIEMLERRRAKRVG